jgi:hypothetical protein
MKLTSLLLLLSLSATAQVTLSPIQVRRANVLLDEREYLIEQLANETLERQLWQRAHSESERLRLNAESQAANISEVAAIETDRAVALESMLKRETAKVRRRQTTGVILATIVAVESVVIAVIVAVK